MMDAELTDRLARRVERGGTLVVEGCPAYRDGRATVGTTQPNLRLDALLGVRESYVEFTPDLLEDLELRVHGMQTPGGLWLQAYEEMGGTAVGWYQDGRVAAVEYRVGSGKTLLIGTVPSYGYNKRDGATGREFFARVFAFGSDTPRHAKVATRGFGAESTTATEARFSGLPITYGRTCRCRSSWVRVGGSGSQRRFEDLRCSPFPRRPMRFG